MKTVYDIILFSSSNFIPNKKQCILYMNKDTVSVNWYSINI